MKFGIFYVPRGKLFDIGSTLLGYNLRKGILLPPPREIRPEWVKNNSPYGFHMTITDIVDVHREKLHEIEKTLQKLLKCFPKNYRYTLQFSDVAFWENNQTIAAVRFKPSESLIILHSLLVCLLQSKGNSSFYLEQLKQSDTEKKWTNDRIHKTELFFSPYIFNEFKPHFSLLNPFGDKNKQEILDYLTSIFNVYKKIEIESLCIVIKEESEAVFKIYKEIPLILD